MLMSVENLFSIVYLIIYIFVLICFLKNKNINAFVRGVFITFCSFSIIRLIFDTLIYGRPTELFPLFLEYRSFLLTILWRYFYCMAYFLLVYGITLLFSKKYIGFETNKEYPIMKGKRRHVGVSLILFVITIGIYFPFWLYRTVKDLKNNFDSDIPYTPGKAVGFLFIPFFNIYWGFYILFSLPLKIKKIEDKYFGESLGFYFHPILIPILVTLFSIMLNLIVMLSFKGFEIFDFGLILFFYSAIFVLWLTIQAKLNAFFDFKKANLTVK